MPQKFKIYSIQLEKKTSFENIHILKCPLFRNVHFLENNHLLKNIHFLEKKQFFADMSPIYIFIILPEVFSCFFTSRDDNYHMTVVENIEIISWIIIITAPLMINIYLFFSFRTSFRLSN